MAIEKFKCDRWRAGQECKPYYKSPWALRALLTALGVLIALATPALTLINVTFVNATPPAPSLGLSVWFWGAVLALSGVAGFCLSMHHEKDAWWCFLAGIGLPSIFVTMANLQQLLGPMPH